MEMIQCAAHKSETWVKFLKIHHTHASEVNMEFVYTSLPAHWFSVNETPFSPPPSPCVWTGPFVVYAKKTENNYTQSLFTYWFFLLQIQHPRVYPDDRTDVNMSHDIKNHISWGNKKLPKNVRHHSSILSVIKFFVNGWLVQEWLDGGRISSV